MSYQFTPGCTLHSWPVCVRTPKEVTHKHLVLFSSREWSNTLLTCPEGISGVGVRREGEAMGKWEGKEGVQVKTDNTQGSQAVNLQGLAHLCPLPPVMPALRLSGQVLQGLCQALLWPGLLSDKRQWGAELFPWHPSPSLRSLITYETDITFLKVLRIRGARARKDTQTGGHSLLKRTQDSSGSRARQPVCVYFQLKVFSFVYHHLFFLQESDTK